MVFPDKKHIMKLQLISWQILKLFFLIFNVFVKIPAQIPVDHSISFLSALKTVMFDRGWAGCASE